MRLLFGILVALILGGCSGDTNRAEVSGSVTLDGQVIEEGAIQFIPTDGTTGPSTGAVISKGRYHISLDKGAVVGKNRVELRAFKTINRTIQDPTAAPGVKTQERVPAFPPEYNDSSTLVREVKPGTNVIDFDIHLKTK